MPRAWIIIPVLAILAVAIVLPLWRSSPDPSSLPLRILFTGETLGELEPCDCAAQMAGGLPARAGYINQQSKPYLLLDTGCIGRGAREFERLRATATLHAMKQMGYHAVNIGQHELWLSPDELREYHAIGVPLVSANVTNADFTPITTTHTLIESAGRRIAVTGVVDHNESQIHPALRVEPPDQAISRLLTTLPDDIDTLVLLADLTEQGARDLAQRFPEIDVILFRGRGDSLEPTRVNRTIIASVYGESRYIADLTLTQTPDQGPVAQGTAVLLDAQYPGDPKVVSASIDWYKKQIDGRTFDLAENRPGSPLIAPRNAEPGNGYVGSDACIKCHDAIHQNWQSQRHATAIQSLQRSGYDYSPECVVCHVVAYGANDGYISIERTPRLANVGCETCHGPGEALLNGDCKTIARRSNESDCRQCHYGKHDPDFAFAKDWTIIEHTELK